MSYKSQNFAAEYYLIDHFIGQLGDNMWSQTLTSGGTLTSYGESGHPGIQRVACGTSPESRTAFRLDSAGGVVFGSGDWKFSALLRMFNLSNINSEYIIQMGFSDNSGADCDNGAFFEYDRVTAGDFWRIGTAANSTRTKTTTSVPISTGVWDTFKVTVNPSGTAADFYINNNQIGSISTNIPFGIPTSPCYTLRKTSGANAITGFDVDLVIIQSNRSALLYP